MLNVPTLWTAFVINFLTMGLIWAYVMRSYLQLEAARYWAVAAVFAATGAVFGIAGARLHLIPLLIAAAAHTIFATCLAEMGIRRFYDRPVSWLRTIAVTSLTCVGLVIFLIFDNQQLRVAIYSFGQAVPLALSLKLLFAPEQEGRSAPGARLAGAIIALILAIYAVRGIGQLFGYDFTFGGSSTRQAVVVMVLLFLTMALNFGFLLMTMDRLRNEVAELALMDDLTGVANRRQLVHRLSEECARSERSGEPFALLVIDLDGFKAINDTHGHAAGDACLRHFTLMTQTRLRPGDLLARTGGDEFCIVLPSSTLREGVMIARRVLDACRQDAEGCVGSDIPIAISVGVAQWSRKIASFPDRLMAAADHALYAAKKEGKNRYAAFEDAPPLIPEEPPAVSVPALRNRA